MMNLDRYVYLIAPWIGWLVAQAIKYILSLRQDGLQWNDLTRSGGMPSSHASFIMSLSTLIGLKEGFDGAIFGLSLALAAIVCYDAIDVRRTTGEQTIAIRELANIQNYKIKTFIHAARGHTLAEVLWGAVTGICVGFALYALFSS